MAYSMNTGYTQPPFFEDNEQAAASGFVAFEQGSAMSQHGSARISYFDLSSLDPSLVAPRTQNDAHPQQIYRQVAQHPMVRFVNDTQRNLFTMPHSATDQFLGGLGRPSAPVDSLPYAHHGRVPSPALSSQGLSSSTCTSAVTPPADMDYQDNHLYLPQVQPGFDSAGFDSQLAFHQGAASWSKQQDMTYPGGIYRQHTGCVNLSQVQGFADQEDFGNETDDSYYQSRPKYDDQSHEYQQTIQVLPGELHTYYMDERLGSSIDNPTPSSTAASCHDRDNEDDEDMDAGSEGDCGTIIVEHADDADYTPTSSRRVGARTRRPTKAFKPLSVNTKHARIAKATSAFSTNKGSFRCTSCTRSPFPNASSLAKHMANAHTRAFTCVFAFAGCNAAFGSKNEWKRHVSSQHLNLTAWVCTQDACGNAKHYQGRAIPGAEFNRKDLFTQHVRRMHAPPGLKPRGTSGARHGNSTATPLNTAFEEQLKQLQLSCLITKRQGPARLRCVSDDCNMEFCGKNAWEERMEHVGKHIEKGRCIQHELDLLLVQWALQSGIIEQKRSGYKLTSNAPGALAMVSTAAPALGIQHAVVSEEDSDEDADADGEVED